MTKRCKQGKRGATEEERAACDDRFQEDMLAFMECHADDLQV